MKSNKENQIAFLEMLKGKIKTFTEGDPSNIDIKAIFNIIDKQINSLEDESELRAYMVDLDEITIIIADNIGDAMDKVDKVYSEEYSLTYANSMPVIF